MDIDWISSQFGQLSDLRSLAQGGQKIVFTANHRVHGDVVLKFLLNEGSSERLEREILAAKLVACDRVPTVHESGSLEGPLGKCIWVIEHRIKGITLRESLDAMGPLLLHDTVRLAQHMLEILREAELNNIVHRDIKPENIMIDGTGNFWLLDFGIARHLDLESLTETKHRFGIGTIGYGSPEQMRNRKGEIDIRADLFSLGVVMWECLMGKNPFITKNAAQFEVLRRAIKDPCPPLRHADDRDAALAGLISTLVQKFPSQRPATIQEAQEWLLEIQEQGK